MGQFVSHVESLATDVSGNGSVDIEAYGIPALIDIVLKESSSLDITVSRILPDGTLSSLYSATGVTADTVVGTNDLTPAKAVLAGNIRVTLANAGEHDAAAQIFLTIV